MATPGNSAHPQTDPLKSGLNSKITLYIPRQHRQHRQHPFSKSAKNIFVIIFHNFTYKFIGRPECCRCCACIHKVILSLRSVLGSSPGSLPVAGQPRCSKLQNNHIHCTATAATLRIWRCCRVTPPQIRSKLQNNFMYSPATPATPATPLFKKCQKYFCYHFFQLHLQIYRSTRVLPLLPGNARCYFAI